MTKTWEEIRDEVAGMLADGESLESIIGKLEEMKNEMAKAELIAVFDELKKPKPLTNEEYIRSCSTSELAVLLYKIGFYSNITDNVMNTALMENIPTEKAFELWLKEKHEPLKNNKK